MARGSNFVIKDIEAHFKLKNYIKGRMLDISSYLMSGALSQPPTLDLPLPLKKRSRITKTGSIHFDKNYEGKEAALSSAK